MTTSERDSSQIPVTIEGRQVGHAKRDGDHIVLTVTDRTAQRLLAVNFNPGDFSIADEDMREDT